MQKFAEDNYKNTIYINFKENDNIKNVFENNLNVDRIMLDISASMPGIKIMPNETLIIFDEIQECTNARASIKAFVNDGRYDVIAIGSLLGIKGYNAKPTKGVPVGSEHTIYMKPMDFEEFLWAKEISQDVIDYIKECFINKKKVSNTTHESMLRYFREYICVGGMPEVVKTFINTNDMNRVYQEQRDLIEEYKDDFGKHLDENENEKVDKLLLARIEEVFDSIPNQLAKENKKFQYSKLSSKARSANYHEAIQWLVDYGVVTQCFNLKEIGFPLEGNKDSNIFKLYFQDSGLFISMLDKGIAGNILSGDLNRYKGAIYENIIADCFSKMSRKLYYYHKTSGLEIDFVTKYEDELALIEVKATSGNTKSSKTLLNNPNVPVNFCIKLGNYNVGKSSNVLTLPYYMCFMLEE